MARRFEFRLERVRALRERSEDEARGHLAAAMAERERRARQRQETATLLDGARRAKRGAAGGGTSVDAMLAHQAFLERVERSEQAAELELHRQDAEVDARRSALQAAARERQVLEKLREKAEREHRAALERAESALLDELALTRHRLGRPA